ncbi:cytochrome C biogenesis protein [Pelomonas sp. Root1217]|uniref:carbohydrate ABC transporter permease n=1 Tax=Pelomonas sp. Root1217 TaxID=1736430 RepID=UPI00070B0823|nr:sugar ABC transporter permease [Pelomonas sp. Root1217]KQV47378.1 cytochrome C biogenesis protein [Pelomonas sp. Root1217]
MKFRIPASWTPYVLVSPFLILFAVFGLFPLLFSAWLAFQSWEPTSGIDSMKFVGLDNFVFALTDGWFWKALRNTLWLAFVSGAPQHLVALPLAVFLHRSFGRWRGLFSGAYFLPYITSTVAIAMLFGSLFSNDYGLINQALHALFGMDNINWMRSPDAIKPAIALVVFWRYVGFNLVLYLAALQTIPNDLYQAAKLDGANAWQQFWRITLPSLKPMILFGVTLSLIGGLQLFEEPFILTNGKGGADQQAMTVAMYLYREAFDFSDFGGASALAWIMFGVIALLTWLTNKAFADRRPQA